MNTGLRAQIEEELERRDWSAENHARLVDFLEKHSGHRPGRPVERPLAVFDADNTTWAGDLGDAAFVYLLRNLKLSPRLHEVLPAWVEVPAAGFGVTSAGRLFAAARVETSLDAMLSAWRDAIAPSASVNDFLAAFSEAMVLPGGELYHHSLFMNAYRVYTGTLIALYNLLDAHTGSVAFDPADARVVTPLFPDAVREFYDWEVEHGGALARFTRAAKGRREIVFPAVLDEGPDQDALRARGRLGAYTQVATWVAMGKTPAELRRLALEIWERSPPLDTGVEVVFPVDPPGAQSPAPIDLDGALPERGMGASSFSHGTKIRPEIVNLMAVMRRHDITPIIITASQVDLVHAVMQRYYDFGDDPIVGMVHALEGGVYGSRLLAPATYRTGKVDAARALALQLTADVETRPVFCAGDTNTDLEFVAYSGDYRLFFDRKKQPFMALAEHLAAHGAGHSTLIQRPFED